MDQVASTAIKVYVRFQGIVFGLGYLAAAAHNAGDQAEIIGDPGF